MKLFTLLSRAGGSNQRRWSEAFAAAAAGDDITIGAGETVLFDLAQSPVYGDITVDGTLIADRSKNTELRYAGMMIGNAGAYIVGTESDPWPRSVIHRSTPSGAQANEPFLADPKNAGGSHNRGIMVMPGGERSWVAEVPDVVVFKLAQTANVGDTSIVSRVPVTFRAGDELVISTTKYWAEMLPPSWSLSQYEQAQVRGGYGSEIITVASDVTNSTAVPISKSVARQANGTFTTSASLQFRHHGRLQYLVPPDREDVQGTCLSYTPYTIQPGDNFGSVAGTEITGAKVLADISAGGVTPIQDHCATVGLLTHPIKFGAPDDASWQTHGYGAHIMVMGLASKNRAQGVERYRCGQAGILGRYPEHQHMRSFTPYGAPGSGTHVGDVEGAENYERKCSTRGSSNRGTTIHGTCGYVVEHNVYVDTDTHVIFLEDGSEQRNTIDGNFACGTGFIGYNKSVIKTHDLGHGVDAGMSGPAGVWYTNVNNYLRNNVFSGCHVGIWNACSLQCFGLSREVNLNPAAQHVLEWKNNEAHSAVYDCAITGESVHNEAGDTRPEAMNLYDPYNFDRFEGANLWKPEIRLYSNQVNRADYAKWRVGALRIGGQYKNNHVAITGRAGGQFVGCFMTVKTLDDAFPNDTPALMITYNGGVKRTQSIFVTAPMLGMGPGAILGGVAQTGGVMAQDDFYIYPVVPIYERDLNLSLLGATPGYYGTLPPPAQMLYRWPKLKAVLDANGGMPGVADSPTSQWNKANASAMKLPADGSLYGRDGWLVTNDPFFLYGTTGAVNAPCPPTIDPGDGGVLLDKSYSYYGLWVDVCSWPDFYTANPYDPNKGGARYAEIHYSRLKPSDESVISTWDFPYNSQSGMYSNMRNAALLQGALYDISWSRDPVKGLPLPYNMYGTISCIFGGNVGWVYLRLDWDGSAAINQFGIQTQIGGQVYGSAASSKAEVLAASTLKWWLDSPNNKLYVCLAQSDPPRSDLSSDKIRIQNALLEARWFINI